MLFHASEFLLNLSMFRVCWLRGRVGGGKTLLACVLAEHFLTAGLVDGVVANFPTVYPTSIVADDGLLFNRAVIFDESWELLDSRTSLTNPREYGAYSRKMGTYWLFPSVYPIDKRLRAVIVWRASVSTVLPIWIYRWELGLDYDEQDGGWFALWRPERYFGRYDTAFIPFDDGGISERFGDTVAALTGGKRTGVKSVDYQSALLALGLEHVEV